MLTSAQKIERALARREYEEKLAALQATYSLGLSAARDAYWSRVRATEIPLESNNDSPIQS